VFVDDFLEAHFCRRVIAGGHRHQAVDVIEVLGQIKGQAFNILTSRFPHYLASHDHGPP
jgi:hypothetical protein